MIDLINIKNLEVNANPKITGIFRKFLTISKVKGKSNFLVQFRNKIKILRKCMH